MVQHQILEGGVKSMESFSKTISHHNATQKWSRVFHRKSISSLIDYEELKKKCPKLLSLMEKKIPFKYLKKNKIQSYYLLDNF